MAIKQVFEKKEDAPEWLHSTLVEQDGKFLFEAETAAEVGSLKKTLTKERDDRKKFEGQIKKFERFKPLVDAEEEEVDQFLEGWNKRNEKKDDGKPDPDAAKQQLELKEKLHAKELKKLTDQLTQITADHQKAQNELREFRLWTPLREIAIQAGLLAEDWKLVRYELAADNRFGFDDDGKVVLLEDGQPSTITPEKFFKEVYSDLRPKFYKATGAGGGGANPSTNQNNNKTIKRDAWDKLPPADREAKIGAGFAVVD